MASVIRPDLPFSGAFADVVVRSSEPLPELPEASAGSAPDVVEIRWQPATPPTHADWFHAWLDGSRIWARFGATADGHVIDFPAFGAFVVSADARRVTVTLLPGVPAFTGRHLLLNQILPVVLSRLGRFVLHAGAWAQGGRASACLGATGSGKSTLVAACARLGAEVMADDSLVVRPVTGGWEAVPSYPTLRLWASGIDHVGWRADARPVVAHYSDKHAVDPIAAGGRFADGPRALTRLVLLGDGEPLQPVAVDLLSQVFRLDVRDTEESARLFNFVADLAHDLEIVRFTEAVETRRAIDVATRLCGPGLVAPSRAFGHSKRDHG